MDKDKFPLTSMKSLSQADLTDEDAIFAQELQDALRWDSLVDGVKNLGYKLDAEKQAMVEELEIKLNRNFKKETK